MGQQDERWRIAEAAVTLGISIAEVWEKLRRGEIEISIIPTISCRGCYPDVRPEDCVLRQFQEAFEASERTPADLRTLVNQFGLTFYYEQGGNPHLECSKENTVPRGKAIIYTRLENVSNIGSV